MTTLSEVLAGPHAVERDRVLALLSGLGLAKADGLPRDDYRDLVMQWCHVLAEQGVGSRSFPVAYGGQDDPTGRVVGFQALAHGDLSLAIKTGVQFGLFGGAVHRLGTQKHHDAYLRDIGTLALPGCFAMSETDHGSDVRGIQTQARYDAAASEFVLHTPDVADRKDWIGGAARHARMAVVFSQLEVGGQQRGVHAFLVPLRSDSGEVLAGIEIEDCGEKMGLNGVDNGRIRFSAVRLPRDNLLDRYGSVAPDGTYSSPIASPGARFFTMIGALVEGRISIAGSSLAVARNALTIAVRWGERRRQFGDGLSADVPLMDYLTHQRRLLIPIAQSFALQSAHHALVASYGEVLGEPGGPAQRELEKQAAGLKALCSWHLVGAVQQARECCGGKGYLSENRFAALRSDSDVFVTFEGDNTVLMQLVAKQLLVGRDADFEDRDALGLVRAAVSRRLSRLVEEVVSHAASLRDPQWQARMLELRERRLVDALARRMTTLVKDRSFGSQEALSACLDHAVAAANAHLQREVHRSFTETVEAHPDLPLLTTLRDLAVLAEIERDRAWWLEHGLLDASDSRALVTEVNELCRALRPAALELVDAFGVPDALLRAPIAV